VLWLIEQVFSKITVPLRIAGKGITTKIKKAAAPFPHIQFIDDPTESKLAELIADAHIHVLPDFNNTGVKLKLLHALFCGRFCITNNNAMPLNNTFVLAQTSAAYIEWIGLFMAREFTITDIEQRADLLRDYNNRENAQLLSAHLL
jgi:glycosyltransferase involved in cell wall biosynthesis